jgi:AraC-like DNA-binding protein
VTAASASPDRAHVRRIRFESSDVDEVIALVGASYGHHSRVPLERGRFQYVFDSVGSPGLAGGVVKARLRQKVRAVVTGPTLFLALRGAQTFLVGRRTLHSSRDNAVLLAPGHEYSLVTGPTDALAVRLDAAVFERALSAQRAGRTRHWLYRSVDIPFDAARRAEVFGWVRRLLHLSDSGSVAPDVGPVSVIERAAATYLAARVIERSGETPVLPGTLQRVDQLRQWVDAHVGEDMSLDRQFAVTGVRWRSLQKACLAATGHTPLELVVARRLAAIRARLESGQAGSVSQAAMDCGFMHLGRFAAAYREAYGESPSTTLARARNA